MISRGDWLAGVWHPEEIDSPGYYTPGRLTRRGMIPRGDWLAGVWYPGEIDSPGYDTLGRLTYRGMIPRESDSPGYDTPGSQIVGLKVRITMRILNKIRKYFYPLFSIAKTGSNDEKNWRSKISLDCPFKVILVFIYFQWIRWFTLFKINFPTSNS